MMYSFINQKRIHYLNIDLISPFPPDSICIYVIQWFSLICQTIFGGWVFFVSNKKVDITCPGIEPGSKMGDLKHCKDILKQDATVCIQNTLIFLKANVELTVFCELRGKFHYMLSIFDLCCNRLLKERKQCSCPCLSYECGGPFVKCFFNQILETCKCQIFFS